MRRVIGIRLAILFLEKFSEASVFPFMALRFTERMGARTAGAMMVVAFFLSMLAGIYAGHLADTRGRRPVLLSSEWVRTLLLMGLAAACWPGVDAPWLAFGLFIGVVTAAGLSTPTAEALVIDLVTPETAKRLYNSVYWVTNVARSSGTLVGAALYTVAFAGMLSGLAVASALISLLITLTLEETWRVPEPRPFRPGELVREYVSVLRDRRFLRYVLANLLSLGVAAQLAHYVAVRLGTTTGPHTLVSLAEHAVVLDGAQLFGLLRIENGVMVVLLAHLVQRLGRGLDERRLFGWGFALFGLGFAVLATSDAAWMLVLFTAVFTVGELMYAPGKLALLAQLAPEASRSRYAAVNTLAFRVALMLGGLGIATVGTVPEWVMATLFVIAAGITARLLISVLPPAAPSAVSGELTVSPPTSVSR